MKERNLFKISLIGSILGIVILWLVSSQIELSESMISKIDSVPEGDEVLVKGVVTKVTDTEKVVFLDVSQEEIKSVTVVLFKDGDVSLAAGDYVEIEGTVEDYEGKREIIGNKVEVK
ncbi:OB-fold nucleic acid binding domain-containing protein [Candidatus Woesearchaeota archaeon]|nr:OB-fold nucleic acid binding domain-containing protein [Candidatus Woesearchaeota archaeon]